ncbi:DUF3991 and toprim domain-containing protein [[Clostridium] innocuum]|nr:DUF3991 and toprim domain-containing protein [[Clostridium] innocuum]
MLKEQGETLIKDGREYRWGRDHSVTIRGNMWFQHNGSYGGCAIDFLKEFQGMNFAEAVQELLNGCKKGTLKFTAQEKEVEPVPFCLPERNTNMRRLFAYLVKSRCIHADVITEFIREGLMYEDVYYNIVFCAKNEDGVIVNAQKKNTCSYGQSYRGTVAGSDMKYSFCHIGVDDILFVFEAPIDMLAYITMHKENWIQHSYIALGGGSEHALLHLLDSYDHLKTIYLATDHDIGGFEIAERLKDILTDRNIQVQRILPVYKDFDEDLKDQNGLEAKPCVDHPGLACLNLLKANLSGEHGDFKDIMESYAQAMYADQNTMVYEECLKKMIAYCLDYMDTTMEQVCTKFRFYRNNKTVESHQKQMQKIIQEMKHQQYTQGFIAQQSYENLIQECIGALVSQEMQIYKSSCKRIEEGMIQHG